MTPHVSRPFLNHAGTMATKQRLNVQAFPRPPVLEKTPRHLQIKWDNVLIAESKDASWVLETHHPPSIALSGSPRL